MIAEDLSNCELSLDDGFSNAHEAFLRDVKHFLLLYGLATIITRSILRVDYTRMLLLGGALVHIVSFFFVVVFILLLIKHFLELLLLVIFLVFVVGSLDFWLLILVSCLEFLWGG